MRILRLGLVLLVVGACSGGSSLSHLPADEALGTATERLVSATSFRFRISAEGAPVRLEGATLDRIDGTFAAPDRAVTAIRVRLGGAIAIIRNIAIGSEVWSSSAIQPEWAPLPVGTYTSTLDFVDALPDVLTLDLTEIAWGETSLRSDDFAGERLDTIEGRLDGTRLAELTYGMFVDETYAAKVLLAGDEPRRVILTGSELTWIIDIWAYDAEVTIEAPS